MNLFDIPARIDEEITEILCKKENVRIERIISKGQTTGWYDQNETEFVALLSGFAVIEYDDGSRVELHAGDTLVIVPHRVHRVAYTSAKPACVWLCVFF